MNIFEFDILWDKPTSNFFESIQFGMLLGFFMSLPLLPSFLIAVREFIINKKKGIRCLQGSLFASFLCICFFLFGSSSFLKTWHYLEPFLSTGGLFLLFRLATSLDASPNRFVGSLSFNFFWFSKLFDFLKNTNNLKFVDRIRNSGGLVPLNGFLLFQRQTYSRFFFFNFKPSSLRSERQVSDEYRKPVSEYNSVPSSVSLENRIDTTIDSNVLVNNNNSFFLGFILLYTNPFLFAPFGHLFYGIQFHDPFNRLTLGISAFLTLSVFSFVLLTIITKALPSLFMGEVNKLSFLTDTFLVCILSFSVLFPVVQMSWRDTFWRSTDSLFNEAVELKKNTSDKFPKLNNSENQPKLFNFITLKNGEYQHFAGEYSSPTFQEPIIQYNRLRPYSGYEPLARHQFEYGVRKYQMTPLHVFGQKYLSYFSSKSSEKESFSKSIPFSFFLQSFYNHLPSVQTHAIFENDEKLHNGDSSLRLNNSVQSKLYETPRIQSVEQEIGPNNSSETKNLKNIHPSNKKRHQIKFDRYNLKAESSTSLRSDQSQPFRDNSVQSLYESPLASLENYVPAGVRGSYIRDKSQTFSDSNIKKISDLSTELANQNYYFPFEDWQNTKKNNPFQCKNQNIENLRELTHKNIGFFWSFNTKNQENTLEETDYALGAEQRGTKINLKKIYPWCYENTSRIFKQMSERENQNNLKGYPQFSYLRFMPLSQEDSLKLRSEMFEYTKILNIPD
uniref:Uncharacterized protein n=1 Tax=Microrhizoidea pickettheapsiorum TaxID=2604950 RepID=A0A5B9RGP1_9CHLO|nr:hypothetical protein [Microrhizoidea pickettheapsiorum]QEG77674.1 hypothetical protein [Microrhizoidea pickettheapsiorum]